MNLKHLRYFWATAHAGSVISASEQLHLTPQTVSAQIKLLEAELGAPLFRPAGRGLELTEAGRIALSYADEIFALSQEMLASLSAIGPYAQEARVFRAGISDALPKSLMHRLLVSLRQMDKPVRLICREGAIESMLGELALHRIDIVLADRPMPVGLAVKGYSHKLGDSALAFFAAPAIVPSGARFPECLNGAPFLLPGQNAAVRGEIDRWLGDARLFPRIVGEFDDSALMKVFAEAGEGYFTAPVIVADEICARYGVVQVGQVDTLRESFWLISTERMIKHADIRSALERACAEIFMNAAES